MSQFLVDAPFDGIMERVFSPLSPKFQACEKEFGEAIGPESIYLLQRLQEIYERTLVLNHRSIDRLFQKSQDLEQCIRIVAMPNPSPCWKRVWHIAIPCLKRQRGGSVEERDLLTRKWVDTQRLLRELRQSTTAFEYDVQRALTAILSYHESQKEGQGQQVDFKDFVEEQLVELNVALTAFVDANDGLRGMVNDIVEGSIEGENLLEEQRRSLALRLRLEVIETLYQRRFKRIQNLQEENSLLRGKVLELNQKITCFHQDHTYTLVVPPVVERSLYMKVLQEQEKSLSQLQNLELTFEDLTQERDFLLKRCQQLQEQLASI